MTITQITAMLTGAGIHPIHAVGWAIIVFMMLKIIKRTDKIEKNQSVIIIALEGYELLKQNGTLKLGKKFNQKVKAK